MQTAIAYGNVDVRSFPMSHDFSDAAVAAARASVLAWVCQQQPGSYPTNDELVLAFCGLLPADTELELHTVRNPSAEVFEARWSHRGRSIEDFPKPFCAETQADARVLACAALMDLPGESRPITERMT